MSFNVRQCRRCNKLFQYSGKPYCMNCIIEMDKEFDTVKNYMYDNPRAGIDDICEATDVSREEILMWLKEGRLILNKENAALLQCEKCGAPIKVGRWCDSCANSVKSQLDNTVRSITDSNRAAAVEKAKQQDDRNGPRMHIDTKKR